MVAAFEGLLAREAPSARAIYILGDLFEAWVGDDALASPFEARIGAALAKAARETRVSFLHGNRDFLVGERFARDLGVTLLPDPTVIDLYGTPTLLLHGDTLCTGDREYQAFRKTVRDPAWMAATLARPLVERRALATSLREASDTAKEGKTLEIMDVAESAVVQAFRDSGCTQMIHGHTHRPGRHVHAVDGRNCVRWVLGDWYESASCLEATPTGLRSQKVGTYPTLN